jgi:phosphonatase-like hydrolase
MEPDLVVFDIAGTTLHDPDTVSSCFSRALAAAQIHASPELIREVMGLSKPDAIGAIIARTLGGAAPHPTLVSRINAHFKALCVEHYRHSTEVREIDGASATFAALQSIGAKVALDTGFSRRITDAILERTGWVRSGLVDAVVTSDEVRHGRPAPDMILAIQQRLGLRAPRFAKVGDTAADLAEGFAAGASWNIGVTYGSSDRATLACSPHTHLIDRLDEVLAVVSSPVERRQKTSAS